MGWDGEREKEKRSITSRRLFPFRERYIIEIDRRVRLDDMDRTGRKKLVVIKKESEVESEG